MPIAFTHSEPSGRRATLGGYSMVSFRARLAKLEQCKADVGALEEAGVELTSEAASSAVLEFIYALDDLAQEFGYKLISRSIKC